MNFTILRNQQRNSADTLSVLNWFPFIAAGVHAITGQSPATGTRTPAMIPWLVPNVGRCSAVGQSALWKYKANYRQGDDRVGQWSDVVSIAVAG